MLCDELRIWLNHFEYHAEHPRCIPQGLADRLQSEERQLIASSLATFQLGEHSEGHWLRQAASSFARAQQIVSLERIIELLVREQQRHAVLLRGFMEDHRIPLKVSDWTDGVFRRLRRFAGLELSFYVLITAELIGTVYYRALESATSCQRLKVLCRTLVCDELAHVGFESHVLLALRAARPAAVRAVIRIGHRALVASTASVVWLTHRRVLRHCGYRFGSFLRVCLAQQAFYLEPAEVRLASTNVGDRL